MRSGVRDVADQERALEEAKRKRDDFTNLYLRREGEDATDESDHHTRPRAAGGRSAPPRSSRAPRQRRAGA